MHNCKQWLRLLTGLAIAVCAGCQSAAPAATQPAAPTLTLRGSFTPYQTITPTRTATPPPPPPPPPAPPPPRPPPPPTWTPLPTVTPTPRTYTVKSGDDMSGIALRYRVPLADLKTANPSINPRLMKIGTVLIIPG